MWITIIDRTKPQPQEKPKPQKYYLKFENVPIQIKDTEIKGLPFKVGIQGKDHTVIMEIDTTPQPADPKKAVSTALDIIPLLFAEKVQIKIPTLILIVLGIIALALVFVGFLLGYLL
ncbi:MAG: hypothetical protein ABIL17_08570 [candidate division WOR-3 bacterium]